MSDPSQTPPAVPSPDYGYPPAAQAHTAPPAGQRGVPLDRRPVIATWVILSLNVLLWLAMLPFGGSSNAYVLIRFGAKVNELIALGQVWRLITPVFLHVGLVHLAFNTYALYAFGPQIERLFGTVRFLSIYLLSGICGVLLSFCFSPHLAAGASGAIFGLLGTEAAFFFRYRNAFGSRGRQKLTNLLVVIGYNLVFTFTASNIDVWGHLGGLAAGAALGWGLMPRYAIVLSERGPQAVDQNHPRQWVPWVVAAALVLVVGSWLAISFRRSAL